MVSSCSWGPTRGLVFDEPAVGSSDRCRSGVVLYIVKIVRKGEGAGFEPMTCSGGALCLRASHQSCTEAKSEVSRNSSPRLFGSVLFSTSFGVDNVLVYSLISALQWYCTRTPRMYRLYAAALSRLSGAAHPDRTTHWTRNHRTVKTVDACAAHTRGSYVE